MNIVFSGQYIYLRRIFEICSGHKIQGRFILYSFFVPRCARPYSSFKRQYCWIFFFFFFSRKLHFVRRLWQIAAAAQNGLVHYMSYVKSELFKSCTSPKTHLCLSSPQGCNGIQPCQLNILIFLHILWQFHINLFTSVQSSVPCYRNNTLRPL